MNSARMRIYSICREKIQQNSETLKELEAVHQTYLKQHEVLSIFLITLVTWVLGLNSTN